MRLTKLAIFSILSLGAASAQAELVHSDWQTADDGKISFDTQTGLEWLKLSVTDGLSIDDVRAEMGEGQSYEGFRVASEAEVENYMHTVFDQFMAQHGHVLTPNPSDTEALKQSYSFANSGGVEYQSAEDMRYMLGKNYSYGSRGYYIDEDDGVVEWTGVYASSGNYKYSMVISQDEGEYITNDRNSNTGQKSSAYGVFLVSTGGATYGSMNSEMIQSVQSANFSAADVSAPLTAASLVLMGAMGLRRRKA